ncbi:MAG: hypothetical protein ACC700_16850 [Anaerolineales bacterium]
MGVLAQAGWGKSDKIERGLQSGHLSGVILSPRDQTPASLAEFVQTLRGEFGENVEILFDPQFYATTVDNARDRHLPDYPYYRSGLTRANFISQQDVQGIAAGVIDYQTTLDLDRILSVAVRVADFNNPWSQIALSLALESVNAHSTIEGAAPLLLSFVVDESALKNREALDEFLDIISAWEVHGFYFLVKSDTAQYPPRYEEAWLENLLYLAYVLSVVNDFELVFGYSDLVGAVLHATGAKHIGTGWYNSLRQFSMNRFEPSTGGQARRPRYTSAPLLSSVIVVPELETISQVGLLANALTGTAYDNVMVAAGPANANWPLNVACLHHWQALHELMEHVVSQGSVDSRLTEVVNQIDSAEANYALLTGAGAVFDPTTGPRHLAAWKRAIRNFRADAGI